MALSGLKDVYFNKSWTADAAFTSLLAAPFIEEALYRWAPLTIAERLDKSIVVPVAIGSSIIFGLHHGFNYYSVLSQGVMGLLAAGIFIRTKSYLACVAFHMMWNVYCVLYFDNFIFVSK